MFFRQVKAGKLTLDTYALIGECGFKLDDFQKQSIKENSPMCVELGYNKYECAFAYFFSGEIEELLSSLDTLQPSPSESAHLANNPGIASDILSAIHTQGSVILYDKTKKMLDICNIFYTKKHFKSNLVIKEFLGLKSRFENIEQDSQSSHINECDAGKKTEGTYEAGLECYNAGDYRRAFDIWKTIAEQGNAGAQYGLGFLYFNGQGVIQDYKEATKYWRLAAEQGHAMAQEGLGWLYFDGQGVIQNYVLAHMWLNIAVSNGNEKARKKRDITQKKMTTEQIAEAQKLAREYIEKNHTKEDAAKYKSNDSTIKVETDEDIPF